jgi:hypothetical protein
LPYLVDGKKIFPKCGMAICYSCNKLVYLGIEHLSIGERCVYNCSEGKFKTEKFRYISFNGEHWGMYQHWATACTGNKFRKLNFKEYMEIKQLIPLDKWMSFHQIIQFGKFRRKNPYTVITDNNYILNKFGLYADDKLYSYALWLENVSRKIRCIRQKRALLNIRKQKEFHQIVNNGQKMQPLYLPQIDRSKEGNTSEIFISSQYAKQNNLLPSINHLN